MWFLTIGNIAVSGMLASQLSKLALSLGLPSMPATLLGQPASLTRIGIALLIFIAAFTLLQFAVRDNPRDVAK